ncbi:TrkH family potassium uptake protein [Martelella mediterranea]|uniref:Trk system potassium uptake protein TrkH n=1 Tax=Martelella mediterranea TaxID=293089 RepID=A0A4R3NR08_9HYPH|nr:TrkH family potassium uptake protein [Martelella mediterranea]TCT37472.1 trk system potassium uptake protein TrkH [Martelella mediterranea]
MIRVHSKRNAPRLAPPLVLILIYAGLIILGTIALKLPPATTSPVTWSDAAFTATSAVTVTGLVVVDTGSIYSGFGQAIVMILIQLGGLGLMTFAVLILSMFGLPVGFTHRLYLKEDLNQTSATDLLALSRMILKVVLVCEMVGAAILALVFVPEAGWRDGLWQAVFHSVSAFNNAGFALFPDSLSQWAGNPIINLTIPALFIMGGLGFTVASDIWRIRSWRHFSLHTKLMLIGTAALLLSSTAAFAMMEWTNPGTLGSLAWPDRLWASWFQAATTRTAGFNTVEIGNLSDNTSLMFMILMFIGAGSTSTGGGIKVTTFIVLMLATLAFFKRRASIHVFGRELELEQVMKVLALATTSILLIISSVFILLLFHEGDFLSIAFETVSAFATVGMSQGTTGDLDTAGRAVIMVVMFIGRVGPITLGFLLATRKPSRIGYPSGTVYLG